MKKILLILTIPILLLLVVIGNRLSNQSASMESTTVQLNSSIASLDVSFVKCQIKRAFDQGIRLLSEPGKWLVFV